MLGEAGGNVRIQDDVRLLREDRVQSGRARLDRFCSGRDLDFKRAQRAITVILFGRGKNVRLISERCAESIGSAGVPTGSVQCEVYPPDVGRYRFPEVEERFALGISLSRRRSSEGCSSNVSGGALMAREGATDGMGDTTTSVTSLCKSCGTNASKGTCTSGADAVPKMLPGSRSRYPERGIICRLEPTKCSEA